MLLVIFSWCYVFTMALNMGLACSRLLRLQIKHISILLFTGLFSIALLTSLWAIFGRIHWEFQLFLLLLNGLVLLWNWADMREHSAAFYRRLKLLPKSTKKLLALAVLTYALICAAPAYFPDHEIYYLQTVKWLNEYGFLKGLANLHLFFGQTSGWHILQSVFSFSFLGLGLHTLNGFCLLVASWYVFSDTENPKIAIFIPIANLLLFPFIAVASPDLAVVSIGFVAFDLFLKSFGRCSAAQFNTFILLCLFVVYIKLTAAPILLLPLFLWIYHFRALAKNVVIGYATVFLVFGVWVVKNTLLTGYPLFPSAALNNLLSLDYALAAEIHDFAFNPARRFDFFLSHADYHQLDRWQIGLRWLFQSGLGSVLNLSIILLMLVLPFFKEFAQPKYRLLYVTMSAQLLLLFATSPQARFMLYFVVFFTVLVVAKRIRNEKMVAASVGISLIMLLFPGIFGWHYPSSNVVFSQRTFSAENLLTPAVDASLKTSYYHFAIGNLLYHSPDANTYIWATGNGPLPCVNEKQLQYLQRKTGYIPQLRTPHLKDGFLSVKATRYDPK